MYWCWVWWTFKVKVAHLIGCKEIWCHAWDAANNCQPVHPTWNLMGMGNNHVFCIKIHLDKTATGDHVFRFEHPTQPGQQKGGWMTKATGKPESAGFGHILKVEQQEEDAQETAPITAANKELNPESATSALVAQESKKLYTLEEIEKHNTESNIWIIFHDKVYDCTEYLELHPGGSDSILINAGGDSTENFVAIHSSKATKMLEKFYIGDLDKASIRNKDTKALFHEDKISQKTGCPITLDP